MIAATIQSAADFIADMGMTVTVVCTENLVPLRRRANRVS